jgi:hypothetical protein
MDKLDPARELIVEAIGTLERSIESLVPAQAPRSTSDEINAGIQKLRSLAVAIAHQADTAENVLGDEDRDGG